MCDHHDHSRDLTFVKSRRELLRKGAGVLAFASASQVGSVFVRGATAAKTATPSETEGPYWVDEKLNRTDVRKDTATGTASDGLPLRLTVSLSKLASGKGSPVTGAYIDIWHCDAYGKYSDESANSTVGKNFLRGYQVTDKHGIVRFTTIYPGWYSGRTPHIHARVRIYSGTTATTNFTTQFFFNESITNQVYASTSPYSTRSTRDTTNSSDNIYNTVTSSVGSTSANPDGSRLLLRLADDGTYCVASFNIYLT